MCSGFCWVLDVGWDDTKNYYIQSVDEDKSIFARCGGCPIEDPHPQSCNCGDQGHLACRSDEVIELAFLVSYEMDRRTVAHPKGNLETTA